MQQRGEGGGGEQAAAEESFHQANVEQPGVAAEEDKTWESVEVKWKRIKDNNRRRYLQASKQGRKGWSVCKRGGGVSSELAGKGRGRREVGGDRV